MGVVLNPQIAILYDGAGVAIAVTVGSAIPGGTSAVMVAGSDGTNARYVRMASDGTVRVDPTGTTTQPISAASLPLPSGAAQEHTTAGSPSSIRLSDGSAFYDAAKTGQLPSALVGSRLDVNAGAWLGSTAPTVGQKTMANSLPVTIASDQTATTLANGAETTVSSSAVQVLAANSSRKFAIIQNTGNTNIRVGITGVTTTTGFRLTPGATWVIDNPLTTQAIYAIREAAPDSKALAMEGT